MKLLALVRFLLAGGGLRDFAIDEAQYQQSIAENEGRLCPECSADIVGNDPHDPECGIELMWRRECADAIYEEPDQEG